MSLERSNLLNSKFNVVTAMLNARLLQLKSFILSLKRYKVHLNIFIILAILAIIGLTAYLILFKNNKVIIRVAAGLKTGESYQLCQAINEVLKTHENNLEFQLIETRGSSENIEMLDRNEVQLATIQADVLARPSARIIAILYPDLYQLIVHENSTIYRVADLKNKKIALPPKEGGQYQSFRFLTQHYEIDKAFIPVDLTSEAADSAFIRGEVDAIFRVRAPHDSLISHLIRNGNGRLIEIDQAAAMKWKNPALDEGVIPEGAYHGALPLPPESIKTVAVQRLLIANNKLSTNIAEKITRILFEYRQELINKITLAGFIKQPDYHNQAFLPIHPGAQRYFDREKPSFFHENAELIALALSILLLIGSWTYELKRQLDRKQKNRADRFNLKIMKLLLKSQNYNEIAKLAKTRKKLLIMLHQVVQELDEDKITPETFQTFAFTWEAAITSIRHREWIITNSITNS
jgi:TRAP transporter TAXI family solute receptor